MSTSDLGPDYRSASLQRLSQEQFDIAVIGGGITGVGAALDAASRGLRVALIEGSDFAAGTSSKSTKLIHGGLRYLEMLDFRLVQEALSERSLMLQSLCPHLVRPVPFLYPLTHHMWERAYVGLGMLLYDTIGSGRRGVPFHTHLSHTSAIRAMPDFRPTAFKGAIRFFDAQMDDARHTLMVARTARANGAALVNHARATGLLRDGARVSGVRVRDCIGRREFDLRAHRVINATGPWTEQVQQWSGSVKLKVRPAKGVHFLLPRDRFKMRDAVIARTEKSMFFIVPWGDSWLLGDTDTEWHFGADEVSASSGDIDYLLSKINGLAAHPVERSEITGVFAGLRPLVDAPGASTAALSREHTVVESAPGLFSIGGGKYTTYRIMARDVVDLASKGLRPTPAKSRTETIPIVGAEQYFAGWEARGEIALQYGITVETVTRLLRRYGSLYSEVLQQARSSPELLQPLGGSYPYLRAEALYAATHEGARTLSDVLSRRVRVHLHARDRGEAAVEDVARLVGDALGWTEVERSRQAEEYRQHILAERDAERQESEQAAAARVRSSLGV
jgi:glycerol-3-phosphate dehydrogenase